MSSINRDEQKSQLDSKISEMVSYVNGLDLAVHTEFAHRLKSWKRKIDYYSHWKVNHQMACFSSFCSCVMMFFLV